MSKAPSAKGKTKIIRKKDKSKTLTKGTSGMTDDELDAAVEAYENSKEGKAARKPKPESRVAQLTKLFYQTPEVQEFRQTAGSINARLNMGDTVSIKIKVPKEFIRLTKFLEQKRVTGSAVRPRPAAKVLNQILLNELHEELHWLIVGPGRYDYYRDLWNRFCDEQGAPEEKIPDPTAPEGGQEGPF